jgi:ubiquinone/menaquinone biosynthesis C-methylase UbiE
MSTRSRLEEDILVVAKAWADSPYYERAEQFTSMFWAPQSHFRRFFDKLDLISVVELACGHGRHTANIPKTARYITIIDIFEKNLEVCRNRLGARSNISFVKGDGSSFRPVVDSSTTAIFCYDAMVHFTPEMVRSYLCDAARILRPGGLALFHHSNYPAPPDRHYGQNPHARNHMTAALFAKLAEQAGLQVVEMVIIPRGEVSDLDCLSLLIKPEIVGERHATI